MNIALISTELDEASINMRNHLLSNYNFNKINDNIFEFNSTNKIKLYIFNNLAIYIEDICKRVEGDIIVFLTKHKSATAKPSLTVHPTGNFLNNELGGNARELSIAEPLLMKELLKSIKKHADADEYFKKYEVTVEQTHHGPLVNKPHLFFEIGSSAEEWEDSKTGALMAKALMEVITDYKPKDTPSVVVFGGGHYNQIATKIMLNTNYAVGHICSRYFVEGLDDKLLMEMFSRNSSKIDFAVLDWKGMNSIKQELVRKLERLNLKYKKYSEFKSEG